MDIETPFTEWPEARPCEFCGQNAIDCDTSGECGAWWIDLAKAREVVRRTLAAVVDEADRQADRG